MLDKLSPEGSQGVSPVRVENELVDLKKKNNRNSDEICKGEETNKLFKSTPFCVRRSS